MNNNSTDLFYYTFQPHLWELFINMLDSDSYCCLYFVSKKIQNELKKFLNEKIKKFKLKPNIECYPHHFYQWYITREYINYDYKSDFCRTIFDEEPLYKQVIKYRKYLWNYDYHTSFEKIFKHYWFWYYQQKIVGEDLKKYLISIHTRQYDKAIYNMNHIIYNFIAFRSKNRSNIDKTKIKQFFQ